MSAWKSQNHSSLSSYAPPSEPLGFSEEESIGAEDIFSMCSLICFIPWRSFLAFSESSEEEHTKESDGSETTKKQQDFEELSTTEHEDGATALPKLQTQQSGYEPVPAWKQKYIDRKSSSQNDVSTNLKTAKRTSLEETLDRCRNIDQSSSCNDDGDDVSSDTGSWADMFSIDSASSLYSWALGKSESDKTSTIACDNTTKYSYDVISPSPSKYKGHRRQLSPSGVVDLVE